MTPKYPNVEVKPVGEDGNAFFIIGRVRRALSHAEVSGTEIEEFTNEATSGNYDNVLRTAMKWVTVT